MSHKPNVPGEDISLKMKGLQENNMKSDEKG